MILQKFTIVFFSSLSLYLPSIINSIGISNNNNNKKNEFMVSLYNLFGIRPEEIQIHIFFLSYFFKMFLAFASLSTDDICIGTSTWPKGGV